jgi:polysaccharide pyruvyl transferase WcaK-like protein
MTLPEFLAHHRLDNTLLLGFYGGGNYGDELLMEVVAGLLHAQGRQHVSIAYQHPEHYSQFHHDFGYDRVAMHDKKALLQSIASKKHIVVGGGGLWGLDTNRNVLLMSIMLFGARWLLRKKVYLLAVGYYDSASRLGRISAWFAGKAANTILARDGETYQNFRQIQKHTHQDTDIAWYIDALDLTPYQSDVAQLEQRLPITRKTLFMTLRRFRGQTQDHLVDVMSATLAQNKNKPIVIALMEPHYMDPTGYQLLETWQQQYPNIQIIDFAYNPLALFLFFRKHQADLVFVGPQFHAILSAHLAGVPYLPVSYDNKVDNLLAVIAPTRQRFTIQSLKAHHIQTFIDNSFAVPA